MHIAINGWFWDQDNTGSGQYIRRLIPALRKLDSSLEITLIMPPHNPEPDNVPPEVMVQPTAKKKEKSSRFAKVFFEQHTFPREAGKSGADLAHVPYWGPPLSSPLPLIVSVLDVIPLMYPAYSLGLMNRMYTSLVSAATRGAAHLITISETSKLDIEEYLKIPTEKISVTYLAPDDHFHPQMGAERDETVRKKYDLPEKFVLYGWGYDLRKQVNELLLAYTYVGEAEGENIPLVLAGKEPNWDSPLFPNMREYAKRLNIDKYLRWIGYVDEEDKPSLYRLADVFAFPSEYEGFGLPPLEAMACGTPVVAWDSIVSDEVLEDGAYLVESSRSMAGAIIALLLQQPFQNTMANQGIAQAKKYSWRKTAQGTLDVYNRVLEAKNTV